MESQTTQDDGKDKQILSTVPKLDQVKSSRFDTKKPEEDSPQQFVQTPYGSKIVPVPKSGSRKDVEVFKRPHAPSDLIVAPKKQRKVLSEDKFAESVFSFFQALEKIIQRECFPELEKLRAQNAYLDAVANNDVQMMRELTTRYGVGKNTPSLRQVNDTPSTFETPTSIQGLSARTGTESLPNTPLLHGTDSSLPLKDDDTQSVASSSKTTSSRKPHELGLNEFLNKYTSEDDQSFQDIVDEGIRKHKLKYAWLYDQEEVHKERMLLAITLPTASEQQSLEYQRPSEVGTWNYKNKNAVMYIPDGVEYTKAELADLARKQNEVEFGNTRFKRSPYKSTPKPDETATSSGSKPLNLIHGCADGKVGFDGKEITGGQTPSVNGFKYVRTPSPTPGVEDTPFLTWGEIEGAPFRLDAGDTPISRTPGTPYRMMATSRRERLALELADKVSSRNRDKKQKTIEVARSYLSSPSPRPKTSVERMSSMSPAAQAFANKLFKKIDATPITSRK
ncbi:Protein DGCR14 [Orchesella cincta]|uniref:Protein DGCR14 n=1 Tax=Orchesella cincta TaxID=48709 RepID=A0A1D2MI28_ORCCI|nr:Protein DGCR14 [Orchesella cincta]